MQLPRTYATLLLTILSDLYEELPEVGDLDKPKLVFFFDEAHLLFDDAPKPLLDKIEQVVRLVRSKGVGVYFVSQNPLDIPDEVLGQLGNRVQHALRAFTPRDQKAVKAAAETFRANPKIDVETVITELGVGEALISTLEEKGTPSIVERALVVPPHSQIGPITPEQRKTIIAGSVLFGHYENAIDRDSAYEMLTVRAKQRAQEATELAEQKELDKHEAAVSKGAGARGESGGAHVADSAAAAPARTAGRQHGGGGHEEHRALGRQPARALDHARHPRLAVRRTKVALMADADDDFDWAAWVEGRRDIFERGRMSLNQYIGLHLEEAGPGWARMSLQLTPPVMNPFDAAHGGSVCALIDSAAGSAIAAATLPDDRIMGTIDMQVHFLERAKGTELVAEARVVRAGNADRRRAGRRQRRCRSHRSDGHRHLPPRQTRHASATATRTSPDP